jgi:HSP20 family protein
MNNNCRKRNAHPRTRTYTYQPAANVRRSETEINLDLALPGWSRDEITLNVEDRNLMISGQPSKTIEDDFRYTRRTFAKRNFQRSFTLGNRLDVENINAKMENGILMVTIPVMARENTKITIQ